MTGIGRMLPCAPIERLSIRWVRLRSSEPGGATRSSTWKISVFVQSISRSSSWENIGHGSLPPLTASAKVPRSATASRACLGDQLGAAPVDRVRVVENLELMDAHYSFFSRWPPNW